MAFDDETLPSTTSATMEAPSGSEQCIYNGSGGEGMCLTLLIHDTECQLHTNNNVRSDRGVFAQQASGFLETELAVHKQGVASAPWRGGSASICISFCNVATPDHKRQRSLLQRFTKTLCPSTSLLFSLDHCSTHPCTNQAELIS